MFFEHYIAQLWQYGGVGRRHVGESSRCAPRRAAPPQAVVWRPLMW